MANGRLTRWLHLGHRWLGIALGLMVLLWFVSGLVMLFVTRPQLDEAERLAGLPVIEANSVRVSPLAAWQALGLPGEPATIRLNANGGHPAYRILANQKWHTVDAENGRILPPVDQDSARRLAESYAGQSEIGKISRIDIDQWTVYRRFDPLRPFWRVEFADGRDYYVATRSGELALDTMIRRLRCSTSPPATAGSKLSATVMTSLLAGYIKGCTVWTYRFWSRTHSYGISPSSPCQPSALSSV